MPEPVGIRQNNRYGGDSHGNQKGYIKGYRGTVGAV